MSSTKTRLVDGGNRNSSMSTMKEKKTDNSNITNPSCFCWNIPYKYLGQHNFSNRAYNIHLLETTSWKLNINLIQMCNSLILTLVTPTVLLVALERNGKCGWWNAHHLNCNPVSNLR
ncbi:hypothetical protein XENORESO_014463 [Xenotaenia resolanae]|uniref:Uncharacterized protein n=1 Tax=Xenotaenia resolanae TaxID=208358 RepID=A0ABV0VQY3_9TELE